MTSSTPNSSSPRRTPPQKVTIRALWGNDDADSTIKISPTQWKKIQAGEEFERGAWGYYEGKRFSVWWRFKERKVTIYGGDMECIIGEPIESLYLD